MKHNLKNEKNDIKKSEKCGERIIIKKMGGTKGTGALIVSR